ncbi:Methyltransferase type 11 domain-containing protein [Frankia sp. AiPs1]|uniref:class I SAM-dependent methyltransferase n=1 Tax=Frankia sp. AiPa1 TaxID=573492 RepID=UPI00202B1A05|nr:class I SAM-dependent methyltransferase [Frankia sp. AiPa1]MCL9760571.1 class I SAM-dependent methyltransferase [Frankia sp. AiPa1]
MAQADPVASPEAGFDELVAQATAVPVDGWDFSWLEGRASEQRPSWGYARLMSERMARADTALDIQTGGGEVLAGVPQLARRTVAVESWPPNLVQASALLRPRGVSMVAADSDRTLPFADATFGLVVSRHPVVTCWPQIARVLRPGGHYLSQQVGPASVFELTEHFLGPQPAEVRARRDPDAARAAAQAAGLDVVDLRAETLHTEFRDVGAVVYFLRKVIWIVPGFTADRHRERLADLHRQIRDTGPFTARTTRFLIEARRPR